MGNEGGQGSDDPSTVAELAVPPFCYVTRTPWQPTRPEARIVGHLVLEKKKAPELKWLKGRPRKET
jgi:hypothetical protein